MSPDEKRYAMKRLEEERDNQYSALRARFTKVKPLSDKDILNEIGYGNLRLRSGVTLETKLKDAFSLGDLQAEEEFDMAGFAKAWEPIRKQFNEARDEAMLGDETKALELIRKLCK